MRREISMMFPRRLSVLALMSNYSASRGADKENPPRRAAEFAPSVYSSVHVCTRRLDDGRPFRKFRLDEFGGLHRRAARRRIDAGLLETLEHGGILHRLVDGP